MIQKDKFRKVPNRCSHWENLTSTNERLRGNKEGKKHPPSSFKATIRELQEVVTGRRKKGKSKKNCIACGKDTTGTSGAYLSVTPLPVF